MYWTTTKPSRPGWYWHRDLEYHEGDPEICHIYASTSHQQTLYVTWLYDEDEDYGGPLTTYGGEWSSEPIPEPEAS